MLTLIFINYHGYKKNKKKFEDVTVVLNYSQAIREQIKFNEKYTTGDEWDEERIFLAAQFCKVFHNKTLNPYVIQRLLDEFVRNCWIQYWLLTNVTNYHNSIIICYCINIRQP